MPPPAGFKLRPGPMLAGIVAMFFTFLAPLAVIAILHDPHPELRVVAVRERFSVLVVDGDERALIVNVDDRESARALLDRLARPWESSPALLIAPADDRAALGLWELLQHSEPSSVVIAGIPGADPLWDTIERACRQRGIDLRYLTGQATATTGRVAIDILAPEPGRPGDHVAIVQYGATRTIVALDDSVPEEPGHVLIGPVGGAPSVDLVINADQSARRSALHEIVLGPRQIARVTMSPSQISVSGGTLRVPVADSGP